MSWTVLVPLRGLPSAKSRLAADLPADVHARLVDAVQLDTVAAARAADGVGRVLVVGDSARAGVDLVQRSAGLNGALRDGAEHARAHWPDDGVVAVVGDLPALRAAELAAVLQAAAAQATAFVPDADGTGTTLLAAAPGAPFEPAFGSGSAARHGVGAHRLDAGASVRRDVDTLADLADAVDLGVGARTAAVVATSAIADVLAHVTVRITEGVTERSS